MDMATIRSPSSVEGCGSSRITAAPASWAWTTSPSGAGIATGRSSSIWNGGRSFDLLPDRKPDTLVAWLEAHGTPEIISRDRGRGYAEGARRGAPNALQVADRFHLLQSLSRALERVLLHKRSVLKAAARGNAATTDDGGTRGLLMTWG